MGSVVAEFLGVIGPDVALPTNMVELIPYLITIFLGTVAVVACYKLLIVIAGAIANRGRF